MATITQASTYQRIYNDINEKIKNALQKGDIVWRKPWTKGSTALPSNLINRKRYRGWNLFFLAWAMRNEGYESPYFLTFLQAQSLGGRIRKGSKGFTIVKWIESKKKTLKDIENDDATRQTTIFPVIHTVFNIAQTENIEAPPLESPATAITQPIEACVGILTKMQRLPSIRSGGDIAAYNRVADHILIPPPSAFHPAEAYYCTLFHEIIHATGHSSRLNRPDLMSSAGPCTPEYCREELTAEFGAAYLCGITGIATQTVTNSAAYIQHWLRALENDPSLVYKACSRAQAAVDFLLPEPPPLTPPREQTF